MISRLDAISHTVRTMQLTWIRQGERGSLVKGLIYHDISFEHLAGHQGVNQRHVDHIFLAQRVSSIINDRHNRTFDHTFQT